ncbi:hypothetical protein LTR37_006754 [Vermiconidia calcicola]|uniref:Uncharacterized protein n=1 Tax=Vermiconidia calcicola TaxID=1690605 RepID=A0ACC3NFF7_9PEZI|nr:hypothetical protein LTR37_006754 [Vermiconidia calcicola]
MTFIPMRIGDNVFIGPNSHISSASISSHVYVGANCVLSPLCIVKESSKILPNTVVPSGMTVPAGTVVGGKPAKILGEVGDGWDQGGGGEGEEWVEEGGDLRALIEKLYSSGRYQSGRAAEDVRICTPEVLKHSNRYRTETAVLNLLETISTVSGDILSTPRVVSPDGRMRTILQDALRPR